MEVCNSYNARSQQLPYLGRAQLANISNKAFKVTPPAIAGSVGRHFQCRPLMRCYVSS